MPKVRAPQDANDAGASRAENEAPDLPEMSLTVGIGASAGGLAAFKTFLDHMPPDTGMSFILVQHLDPQRPSMLVELLASHTTMPVTQAQDGEKIAGNHVYIIPPNATLTIKESALRVATPAPAREHRRPIDTFFAALAEDQKECAVSIVLSGVGSDGAAGLRAVKINGGLTLAQAEFDETAMQGMPTNAAATGLVDHVVPVEQMPERLVAHQRKATAASDWRASQASYEDWAAHLRRIGVLLRAAVGHDFTDYKRNTQVRRVQRRMQASQIDAVADYIARLEADPHEADLLFRELLIGVTQFFRDPESFDVLRATIFPELLKNRQPDHPIRVWVPGCATGEEVYSLAILLEEAIVEAKAETKVQIFGTDLDANAIAVARAARYRKGTIGVSAEHLKRWFAEDGEVISPIKPIREMCVFSIHSLIKDPPFSRLDLISCRNVLIYLNSQLQHRVAETFHYALKPGGTLFLGPSEGITRDAGLFTVLNEKHRILQRRDNGPSAFPSLLPVDGKAPTATSTQRPFSSDDSVDRNARRVMEPYSPTYFVIDRNHDIVRFSGAEAGHYLEPSAGAASLNLFSMLRKVLRPTVRAAVLSAETSRRGVVQETSAPGPDGRSRALSLIVEPIDAGLSVVAFRELGPTEEAGALASEEGNAAGMAQELRTTKAQLKAAVTELETYMEEAKSATEEMQSVNEELQSSNEELETSKEEMQSINEELQTLNGELQGKNAALAGLNDDLRNLLDSTKIATVFLDRQLHIRSFTPAMTAIFPLRDADRGRPITDIVSDLRYGDLVRDAEDVQRTLRVIEREVQRRHGNDAIYLLRMRPYRTLDDRLDGVVITFVDVTQVKRAQAAELQLAAIVHSSSDAIVSVGLDGAITSWNNGATRLYGYMATEVAHKPITIVIPQNRHEEEHAVLERIRRGERIEPYETVRRRKDGSLVEILLTVSPVKDATGKIVGTSKVAHDITERRRTEKQIDGMVGELSHRTKNVLSVVQAMANQTARFSPEVEEFLRRFNARLQGIATSHDLLVSQKWLGVSLDELVHQHLDPFGDAKAERFEMAGPPVMVTPSAAQAIGIALHELATNASKYGALSVPPGSVAVEWKLETVDGAPRFRLTWRERGGPPVSSPEHHGFGRVLIEGLTADKLDAKTLLTFAREGVTWTLDAAAADVLTKQ